MTITRFVQDKIWSAGANLNWRTVLTHVTSVLQWRQCAEGCRNINALAVHPKLKSLTPCFSSVPYLEICHPMHLHGCGMFPGSPTTATDLCLWYMYFCSFANSILQSFPYEVPFCLHQNNKRQVVSMSVRCLISHFSWGCSVFFFRHNGCAGRLGKPSQWCG